MINLVSSSPEPTQSNVLVQMQSPLFLFNPPTTPTSGYYLDYYSVRSVGDFTSQYSAWTNLNKGVFEGLHVTLTVAGFSPSAGVYYTSQLAALADWLHTKGAKLKVSLYDQTYLADHIGDIPDHFPTWGVSNGTRKVITLWEDIAAFDVDALIAAPTTFDTFDIAQSDNGTYRWFHLIYTLLKTLKDKPAFVGFSLPETAGDTHFSSDSNVAGVSNNRGIYGITNLDGTYNLQKCYSISKYLMYCQKIMKFVDSYCPTIRKSIQINYPKLSIGGNVQGVTIASSVITKASHGFVNGDALGMLSSSYQAASLGLDKTKIYYVVNASTSGFQVSELPSGTPVTLVDSVTPTEYLYLVHIDTFIEQGEDTFVTLNGYQLNRGTKFLYNLATTMKLYDFGISAPDIITAGLESDFYSDGSATTKSVVDTRLDMLNGTGWFSNIGTLSSMEIQAQDSSYRAKYVGTPIDTIIQNYGVEFNGYYSFEQQFSYAKTRLKASAIICFVNNDYPPMTAEPLMYDAITSTPLA